MSSTGMQLTKLKDIERKLQQIRHLPQSHENVTPATREFGSRRESTQSQHSDFPEFGDQAAVQKFLTHNNQRQREAFYQLAISDIQHSRVSPEILISFLRWEPNLKLVQRATRDFLVLRHCSVLNEFDGVKIIVDLFEQNALTNPGAVFAGLLSMGDRRINSVIRMLRARLSLADIREFSRNHPSELHAASIEFYLDWLLELQHRKETSRFNMVCAALKLMVLHDESGSVFDYSEQPAVGFSIPQPQFSSRFEDYLERIEGILGTLGTLNASKESTATMISTWHGHALVAAALRSVYHRQPCNFKSAKHTN